MFMLLSLLHHIADRDGHMCSFSVEVAVLADKYDCIEAVAGRITVWLRDSLAWTKICLTSDAADVKAGFDDLLDGMIASYIIRDRTNFRNATRDFVLWTGPKESFTEASARPGTQLLPASLFGKCSADR